MIVPYNNKGQERRYCSTEHRRKGMTERAQKGLEIARGVGPEELETLHMLTEMRRSQRKLEAMPMEHQRLIGIPQANLERPWLTLSEAAEYSGLPKSYLLRKCRDGWLGAINVSTEAEAQKHPESAYRIKRADLTEGI